uniref:Uncharacterized protein n=1 Tax=Setaria digitata TaxID=48799 RepID=A0A915PQA0_9BILA
MDEGRLKRGEPTAGSSGARQHWPRPSLTCEDSARGLPPPIPTKINLYEVVRHFSQFISSDYGSTTACKGQASELLSHTGDIPLLRLLSMALRNER